MPPRKSTTLLNQPALCAFVSLREALYRLRDKNRTLMTLIEQIGTDFFVGLANSFVQVISP